MKTMFEDLERLDRIVGMLKMLQGSEKIVVAMYLIHCTVEETGESLDAVINMVNSLVEKVMEEEERGDFDD